MSSPSRRKQQNKKIIQMIQEVVKDLEIFCGNKISGKLISLKLYQKFKRKQSPKKCYQLYIQFSKRYKNYISPEVDPNLTLTLQQKNKIYQHHSHGYNNEQIKQQMNLSLLNSNTLKNNCKMPKQKMGRILKTMMNDRFQKVNIDARLFTPKDQFRVLLILFSSTPLLEYYFSKQISIYSLGKSTKKFDGLFKQINPKKIQSKQSNKRIQSFQIVQDELRQKQLQIMNLKKEIMTELLQILEIYQEVYNDSQMRSKFIGTKDKHLKEKFLYTKAIILDKPLKVCQSQQYALQLTSTQSNGQNNMMNNEDYIENIEINHNSNNTQNQGDSQQYCKSKYKNLLSSQRTEQKKDFQFTVEQEEDSSNRMFTQEMNESEVNYFFF